jgi:hypothetical protein
MKQIIGLLIIIQIIALTGANAQSKKHKEKWEKFRSEKIAFLTSHLELTPQEAQKFWPVYNQMEQERWEAQKLRREMGEKIRDAEETLSDKEMAALTKEFAATMQKEADIMVRYNEKFLKILPPAKVLKLYKAENEFRMHMIKKFRDKHNNDRD